MKIKTESDYQEIGVTREYAWPWNIYLNGRLCNGPWVMVDCRNGIGIRYSQDAQGHYKYDSVGDKIEETIYGNFALILDKDFLIPGVVHLDETTTQNIAKQFQF